VKPRLLKIDGVPRISGKSSRVMEVVVHARFSGRPTVSREIVLGMSIGQERGCPGGAQDMAVCDCGHVAASCRTAPEAVIRASAHAGRLPRRSFGHLPMPAGPMDGGVAGLSCRGRPVLPWSAIAGHEDGPRARCDGGEGLADGSMARSWAGDGLSRAGAFRGMSWGPSLAACGGAPIHKIYVGNGRLPLSRISVPAGAERTFLTHPRLPSWASFSLSPIGNPPCAGEDPPPTPKCPPSADHVFRGSQPHARKKKKF
jgi:hypothetical protein